jgi:site-specific DNA-methyltransferase (adenine-specific)
MTTTLLHGDCREVLRSLPDCSVDSVVTDPPYGLEFMGKDWDAPWKGQAKPEFNEIEAGTLGGFTSLPNHSRVNNLKCGTCAKWKFSSNPCVCENPSFPNARRDAMVEFQMWFQQVASEMYRVLKPGGHLLAFGGTRTYHRMACAIEDAGFEIRDSLHWVYGSGFPKSLDVSKAIDKAAGALSHEGHGFTVAGRTDKNLPNPVVKGYVPPAPATDAAKQWEGWGTALKPAHEPIVLARKPLIGTVAANVLTHGTGALNIDGARVGMRSTNESGWSKTGSKASENRAMSGPNYDRNAKNEVGIGRWPANVIFDTEAGALLDEQSGVSRDGVAVRRNGVRGGEIGPPGAKAIGTSDMGYGGQGGASRFFTAIDWEPEIDVPFRYVPKPSKRERTCEGTVSGSHPTVKPLALMRWLVKLVTPPGGTVLEPFAGSGTTLMACVMEGYDAIGIELTDEYLPIIRGRVAWAEQQAQQTPDPTEHVQETLPL